MKTASIFLLLAIAGCEADSAEGPSGAYKEFVSAEETGDDAVAWNRLSKATQDELTREAKEIAKVRGLESPADGRLLAFGEVRASDRKITSASEHLVSPDDAVVTVVDDRGEQRSVHLVREVGEWRIDLTEEIRKAGG